MTGFRSLFAPALLGTLLGCAAGDRVALELPPDADVWWATVSPDGRAAWAERRGSDAFLHFGSRRDGPYP